MAEQTPDIDSLYPQHLTTMLGRIEAALVDSGLDALLIAAGYEKVAFLDDKTYPFISNPQFRVLAPAADAPGSFILVRPGERPQLFLHQPRDYWHLPPTVPGDRWTDEWDITTIASINDMHNVLGNRQRMALIAEDTTLGEQLEVSETNPSQLLDHLHFQRAYKTPYEVACIRAANQLAVRGHLAAEAAFRDGRSEFDIQQAYLTAIRARERDTPYGNIIALNAHGAVLHYQHYELEPPPESLSMLIDAGADYRHYAADVTRTHAMGDGEFATLIQRMDAEQRAVIDDIATIDNYVDLHRSMHERLARVLVDFGFARCAPEGLVESGATAAFLPHGLGHLIGVQTHDVGGQQQDAAGRKRPPPEAWPALRLTRPIEDGQVFTIEPGLYFIPMLLDELKQKPIAKDFAWDRIEAMLPFGGIRIEDNVLVENGRAVNLTRQAFGDAGARG